MKTRSCKAKGRRLVQDGREMILGLFEMLEGGDVLVPAVSQPGEDLWLSPAARRVLPLVFEFKNCETVKAWDWIRQAESHSHDGRIAVVVFSRNHEKHPYAMIRFADLLGLVRAIVPQNDVEGTEGTA